MEPLLDQRTFDRLRTIVYEQSGITLGEGKRALVCARLGKRMRALGIGAHSDYLARLEQDEVGAETVHLLDAISTNVTSFFREAAHFTVLGEAVKRWQAQGQRVFRVWSAACSTGEEPYSLAMTLADALGEDADFKILATDICTPALLAAQRAEYELRKVEPIPADLKRRYVVKLAGAQPPRATVRPDLRARVLFRRANLSAPPFPIRRALDAIFCRNVMIYFDNRVRTRLLNELCRLLKPGGYLMVGHAESLTGIMTDLRPVKPAVYVKG